MKQVMRLPDMLWDRKKKFIRLQSFQEGLREDIRCPYQQKKKIIKPNRIYWILWCLPMEDELPKKLFLERKIFQQEQATIFKGQRLMPKLLSLVSVWWRNSDRFYWTERKKDRKSTRLNSSHANIS